MRRHGILTLALLVAAGGCECSSKHESGCNSADPNACPSGSVCEPVAGNVPACFAPVVVKGQVTSLVSAAAIPGARVVALDANRAPASNVATTDAGGAFTLAVPATRDGSGKPVSASVTLRADALGYQSFPGGIRTALPIDLSTATYVSASGQWVVQGQLTAVGLIPLSASSLYSISGAVPVPASRVGVLVVASPGTGTGASCVPDPPVSATAPPTGITAIAAADGSYTIFNVPGAPDPGINYCVEAYAKGVNYVPGSAAIVAAPATVNLTVKNTTTASFSGNLIFNSGATTPTSVALVVRSTYDPVLDRGESPPGVVAQVPSGNTYAFTGVPDGSYTALAAFPIDGDVRDQSGTGNTAPVEVTVAGGSLQGTAAQFKLVAAVDLASIDGVAVGSTGAPVTVTSATPVFAWTKQATYASAATFRTDVFDAFGNQTMTATQSAGGSGPFTETYAGTALQSGMFYQLRITALDGASNPLSQTEDAKGVFFFP